MMKEGKELKKSETRTEIETGSGGYQKCHEIQRNRGKVNEIETMFTITEKRDSDIIDHKTIEVVAVNCPASLREGKMPRGSTVKLGILSEELATAGPLLVRNAFILH
jgi:hypothetical protein